MDFNKVIFDEVSNPQLILVLSWKEMGRNKIKFFILILTPNKGKIEIYMQLGWTTVTYLQSLAWSPALQYWD